MRLTLLALALLLFGSTYAQQHYFLYIQTENKQPFYVKLKDRIYSSSATGYVVISKLLQDKYTMKIGFNKDAYPEQDFNITVDKDAGYLLKNFGEKGWGLSSLQSSEVVMNSAFSAKEPVGGEEDSFSKTLSMVVNSPELKSEPVKAVQPEPVKITPPEKVNPPAPEVKKNVSQVRLILNKSDRDGRQMIYIDGPDTVRIFIEGAIPEKEKPIASMPDKTEEKKTEPVVERRVPVEKTEPVKEVVKTQPKSPSDSMKVPVKEKAETSGFSNTKCSLLASQDDFLKLRKKMAAEKDDDAMIAVARKQFRSRCFATEQVKNLSVLFLTDEGRYKFFDAAYPYVHDTGYFGNLETLLADPYYRTRFRAMIRQ